MKAFLVFTAIFLVIFPLFSQEKIEETVRVEWWVLPLYAVDKDGNSVMDLKKEDITLFINKKKFADFILYSSLIEVKEKIKEKKILPVFEKRLEKERIVFLLFDNILTDPLILMRSKVIAEKIVEKLPASTQFVLMSLEPGIGIKYLLGPIADKDKVIKTIKKKIIMRKRDKVYFGNSMIDYNDISYRPDDPESLAMPSSRLKKLKIAKVQRNFYIKSLINFQYALKLITNKTVYFLSSGIKKRLLLRKIGGYLIPDGYVYQLISNIGRIINENGAVFFIINPSGKDRLVSDLNSGELSLNHLSKASGGKYFEGTKEVISDKIVEMNRCYYEVAFPDTENLIGDIHKIEIKSRRPGIKIYSPRIITRGKDYKKMNEIERELLVLNVIESGYWAKTKMEIEEIKLKKLMKEKDKLTYRIPLAEDYLEREMDIYKVWVNKKKNDTKIEKKRMIPRQVEIQVRMKKIKGYTHYIVVINVSKNTALFVK